jgi:hypothetical protein
MPPRGRKPAATRPAAAKAPAEPKPDATDARIGRGVREVIAWIALVGMWVLSGWIAVELYQSVPGGVQGAVSTDAVIGVVLMILIRWWGR